MILKLIVGLGNPGARYQETRHNAGKWFVTAIAKQHRATFKIEPKFLAEIAKITPPTGEDYWLLIPTTYMNQSGQSVQNFLRFYNIQPENILVAHDEIDLPIGAIRFKQGGGHAGHNGLRHIIQCLGGQNNFQRLRIGIGRPMPETEEVVQYVLSPPTSREHIAIQQALDKALMVLPKLLSGTWQEAMNELHQHL